MINLILGAPGSGKGSMATLLQKEKGVKHVSTGDILRQEIASQSALGKKVKAIIDAGDLVDDNTMAEIISSTLSKDKEATYLLDGFPRTLNQAKLLEEMSPVGSVIFLDVSAEIVTKRILGRRICPSCQATFNIFFSPPKSEDRCDDCNSILDQRSDDNEKSIKHRLDVYNENISGIRDFYKQKGKFKTINGEDSIPNVYQKFVEIINI